MKDPLLQMANRVCIMCLPAPLRIFFRAIKPCRDSMFPAGVAGIRMGCRLKLKWKRSLGFTNKQQIEAYGIAKFNDLCQESAFTYIQEWEKLTDRIGYWVDLESAYITFTNDYMESVWWILKNFWDKDLLYQGYKVVPYCPRCGTPLSDHEVAQGYQDTTDPSVFVRMPLVDTPGTSLLVWTTTPWTLPANVAVAAGADVDYVTVERHLADGTSERLILAEALVSKGLW